MAEEKKGESLTDSEFTAKYGIAIAPLEESEKHRSKKRYARWKRHSVWRVKEACDIAYGILPIRILRRLSRHDVSADDLYDAAIRAIHAKELAPLNPHGNDKDLWVRRPDFVRWIVQQKKHIGPERATFLRDLYAEDLHPDNSSARKRVLDSGYTNDELEICFLVIEEFWLPAQQSGWRRSKEETIKGWIKEKFPDLSGNKIEQIYAITRTEQHQEPRFISERVHPE